ncbi:hypothetical protein [Amycolatopsis sp. NPDC054798]
MVSRVYCGQTWGDPRSRNKSVALADPREVIEGFPAPPPVSRAPRRFPVVLALFVVVALAGAAGCGYGLLTVFGYRSVKGR